MPSGNSGGGSPPPPPNLAQSYQQGINVYLQNLPRMLNQEQQARSTYDPQAIAEQQGLQAQFGPTQYAQMLQALQQIDPTGYNLREQTGKEISNELAAGSSLTSDQSQALEQQIRRSSAARGNVYGQAPVQAEAFTKGMEGLQLQQQRLQNAMNFQNAATPEQWMQMIPPVQADRSMAYVNPNAGFQGEQFALQNYQNQVAAQQLSQGTSTGNPWMSAIGTAASVVGPILGGLAFSDKRIKTDIKPVGHMNGINIVEHGFKGDPSGRRQLGVIAQDVARTRPDAVSQHPSGLLQVDYRKLGLPLPIGLSGGGVVGDDDEQGHIFNARGEPIQPPMTPEELDAIYRGQQRSHEEDRKKAMNEQDTRGFSAGGKTTDTIPAMLTPGEVVLNKPEQAKVGLSRIMKAIGHRHGRPMGNGIRGYSEGAMVDIPPANLDNDPLYPNQTPMPEGMTDLVAPGEFDFGDGEGGGARKWFQYLPQYMAARGLFHLGQGIRGSIGNWFNHKFGGGNGNGQSNWDSNISQGAGPTQYDPAAQYHYLESIGYEPGQGNASQWPGAGPSMGALGVGGYGVGGQGGSFFHDLNGVMGGPLAGAFGYAGLGGYSGTGNMPTSGGGPTGLGPYGLFKGSGGAAGGGNKVGVTKFK